MKQAAMPQDNVINYPAFKLSGHFTVELVCAKTGIVKRRLEFDNLITNAGLDGFMSGGVLMNSLFGVSFGSNLYYCAVGTDSTAPAVTQTTLGAEISPSSTHRTNSNGGFSAGTTTYVSGTPDYHKRTMTWVFSEAQANGNLTEIGIFTAQTGGTMWTRQLLKDSGGTPTTVVKTSAEQLRVVYELRIQPPQADVTGTVVIDSVSYDYVVRPRNANGLSFDGWGYWLTNDNLFRSNSANHATAYETQTLSSRTGTGPSGTNAVSSSVTVGSYTGGTYYRDYTCVWQAAVANFGLGVGSMTFLTIVNTGSPAPLYQVSFAATSGGARIPKIDTKRLTIVLRVSVARV